MNKAIIYNHNGMVNVFIPSPDAISLFGLMGVAKMAAPRGAPFKFIDVSEVPEDGEGRDSWVVDDKYLTDGIGEADF